MKKVAVISLGCPKNLIDSEEIIGSIKNKICITDNPSLADYIIVNTCGFIESAKKESIDAIFEAYNSKKDDGVKIIVTGCMAKRYSQMIKSEIPEVDAIVGIGDVNAILEILGENATGISEDLPKTRHISTGKGYAYLRISDGCDNRCTYCVIPSIRGAYKSRTFEEIIEEAQTIADSGIKELVLVAQDTTYYGIDLYKKKRLAELINSLSKIDGIKWIRLLYAYPEEIDDNLINEFITNEKLCKYIDMPIQHISDNTLKAMARRGKASEIREVIAKFREKIPEMVIRTTFIVGFPGETPNDFKLLFDFIKETKFERLGVFTYSKEEGTIAAKMKNQILKKVKKERFDLIMNIQSQISKRVNTKRLNKTYEILVEGVSEDGMFYYGRSFAEAPEIDPIVYFTSEEPLSIWSFVKVKILNVEEYDLVGAVSYESSK